VRNFLRRGAKGLAMARPTHDEIIRELSNEVAVLKVWVKILRAEVKGLRRELREASARRWSLVPPIVGAVVSGVIAALVAYFVAHK